MARLVAAAIRIVTGRVGGVCKRLEAARGSRLGLLVYTTNFRLLRMLRLLAVCASAAALVQFAACFSTTTRFPQLLRPGTAAHLRGRSMRPSVADWTCSDEYKIVPSQLEGTGGGWTIQGVKPVIVSVGCPL